MYTVELEDEFSVFCEELAEKEKVSLSEISTVEIILKLFFEAYEYAMSGDGTLKKRIERFRHIYALIFHEDFISEFCGHLKEVSVDSLEKWVAFASDGDYYEGFMGEVINDGLFEVARIVMNDTGIYPRAIRYEAFGMRLRVKLLMEFNRVTSRV